MVKYGDGEGKKLKDISQKGRRKPYVKPQLTRYGHIKQLTEGAGGTKTDAGGRRTHP